MKIRFLHIFLLLAMIAAAANAQSAFRTITIETLPNAVVWLDDVRYGKTSNDGRLSITTISPGAHTLRVRADGYKEKTQPLMAAQRGEIKVELVKTSDE